MEKSHSIGKAPNTAGRELLPPVSGSSAIPLASYASGIPCTTVSTGTSESLFLVGEGGFLQPVASDMMSDYSPLTMADRTLQVVEGGRGVFSESAESVPIATNFSEGGVLLSISEQNQAEEGDRLDIMTQEFLSSIASTDNVLQIQQQTLPVFETDSAMPLDSASYDNKMIEENEGVKYRLMMAECKALVDDEYSSYQLHKGNAPIERVNIAKFTEHEFNSEHEIREFYQAIFDHCGYQSCPYHEIQGVAHAPSCGHVFSPLQLRLHLFEYHKHKYGFKCNACNAEYMAIEPLDIHVQTESGHKGTNGQVLQNLYVSRKDDLRPEKGMDGADISGDESEVETVSSCSIAESDSVAKKSEVAMDISGEKTPHHEDVSSEESITSQTIAAKKEEVEFVIEEGRVFDSYQALTTFLDIQKSEKTGLINCPYCENEQYSLKNLKAHLELFHNILLPKFYSCGLCNFQYQRLSPLEKHVSQKHGELNVGNEYKGAFVINRLAVSKIQAETTSA